MSYSCPCVPNRDRKKHNQKSTNLPPLPERNKSISLGLPGVLIGDNNRLLEFTKGRENCSELICGGFPAEAANEELPLCDVGIGDRTDGVEDKGVPYDGVLEDFEELILCEGIDDFANVLWRER